MLEGLAYWWVTFPDLNPGISSLKFNTKLQLSTVTFCFVWLCRVFVASFPGSHAPEREH